MKEAHDLVTRGLGQYKEYRQQRRKDILVSYLDGPAKSGATLAKLYIEENRLLSENVVEQSRLGEVIQRKKQDIKAILFVDDFIGTGNQASENLKTMSSLIGDAVKDNQLRLVLIASVACAQGRDMINEVIDHLGLPMQLHCCEILDDDDYLFTDKSKAFTDPQQREAAKEMAIKYGKRLLRDNPLGFGERGLAIVFEHGIPNDSLPFLWEASNTPKWMPLFKRH